MSEGKFVIQNTDMPEDVQQEVTEYAAQALEKYYRQQDIASYMKREFDTKYDPAWHCFVGRKFGCHVTHKSKHFIYFYLGQLAILLFKSA